MELISVIVPVYRVEKYLKKCIDSILEQTYRNMEIILVDDGSDDSCPDICEEYAKIDKRVKVIHQTNGGLSAARNSGIRAAKGKYISFIDSDDYIEKDMYEVLVKRMQKDESQLAVCNYMYVDESGNFIESLNKKNAIIDGVITPKEALERLILDRNCYYIPAWNKLYERSLFKDIQFPEGKLNEDEFVVHYIYEKCRKISCVEKELYYYVQRMGSIMNTNVCVKRLDVVEAYLERTEYFMEKGQNEFVTQLMNVGGHLLLEGSIELDERDPKVRSRIGELKREYDRLYCKLKQMHLSSSIKSKMVIGLIHRNFKLAQIVFRMKAHKS